MKRKNNSVQIPIDIILEILSKSSAKSIAKFGLASKFCASILNRPDITELFLTRSSTRPRLLFAIEYFDKLCFYSSPQLQNPDENHSLIAAADFHMQFLGYMSPNNVCAPVSRLLYFSSMKISEDIDNVPVICNPSTGQYVILPQLRRKNYSRSLLGYDPIGKQYKILAITKSRYGEEYILTLGTGKMSWREIKRPVNHYPNSQGICINGILYYIAVGYKNVEKLVCFDVRSERFRFLEADSTTRIISTSTSSSSTKLINYKGKFCLICLAWLISFSYDAPYQRRIILLDLWILEDVQKQEWLQREYRLPMNVDFADDISVAGVTASGEIILSPKYTSNPFFVFYFNPERNTLEKVGIQGFEAPESQSRVYTFVDYAEDYKFT